MFFDLCKTPLGETGSLGNPYFTHWLPKHPVFLFILTLIQSVLYLNPHTAYPSLCSPCVTYATLCHTISHQVLPTPPLRREAEEFSRGGNHSKHVPLPLRLDWFQPIYYNSRLPFILVKTGTTLLVVKTLIKIHIAAATLTSIHKNVEQQSH